MAEVELVNGNDIPVRKNILLDSKQAGAPEINHAVIIFSGNYLPYSIVLRAWTVIDEISQLNGIRCPSVIRKNHRK